MSGYTEEDYVIRKAFVPNKVPFDFDQEPLLLIKSPDPSPAATKRSSAFYQPRSHALLIPRCPPPSRSTRQEEWVPLLKATDIAPGDLIPVETDGLQLLLAADQTGRVYCTAGVRSVGS
jgi:hypothetical protein